MQWYGLYSLNMSEFSFSGELFLRYTCNFKSDNFESKVGQLSPADAEFYLWCRVSKSISIRVITV